MNKPKIITGSTLGFLFFVMSKAFAQTNAAPLLGMDSDPTGSILSALLKQAVNNPASLSVILFLMVVALFCDDLPWPPNKYVMHVTIITGVSIYWAFANPETVSKIYPHPFAVYISNGAICGAIAFFAHKQAVNRLRNWFKERKEDSTTKQQTQNQTT